LSVKYYFVLFFFIISSVYSAESTGTIQIYEEKTFPYTADVLCDVNKENKIYLLCNGNGEYKFNREYVFCENEIEGKLLVPSNNGYWGKYFEMTSEDEFMIFFTDKKYGEGIRIELNKYSLKMIYDDRAGSFYEKLECKELDKVIP